MERLADQIAEWLEPKLEELGAFLVDVKQNPAQHRIEVYLDRDAGKPGIDIETCTVVSRYLQFQLDHGEATPKNYILEVSSPGMDNPFKVLRQYKKYQGALVEVLLLDGRKLDGILADSSEEGIVLDRFLSSAQGPSPGKLPAKLPGKLPAKLPAGKDTKNKGIAPETERTPIAFSQIKSTKRKFEF